MDPSRLPYSKKHGLDIAKFSRDQNRVDCFRQAAQAATRGALLGLGGGYLGILIATKRNGQVVKSITKAMGLSMAIGLGLFVFLEKSIMQCRRQLEAENVAEYWSGKYDEDDITIVRGHKN